MRNKAKEGKYRLGLAQIPLLIILLVLAIAVPVATKLVQQSQETRKSAAENLGLQCVKSGGSCKNQLIDECSGRSEKMDCPDVSECCILATAPTLVVPRSTVTTVPTVTTVALKNGCNAGDRCVPDSSDCDSLTEKAHGDAGICQVRAGILNMLYEGVCCEPKNAVTPTMTTIPIATMIPVQGPGSQCASSGGSCYELTQVCVGRSVKMDCPDTSKCCILGGSVPTLAFPSPKSSGTPMPTGVTGTPMAGKYKCVGGVCIQAVDGTYNDGVACGVVCGVPTGVKGTGVPTGAGGGGGASCPKGQTQCKETYKETCVVNGKAGTKECNKIGCSVGGVTGPSCTWGAGSKCGDCKEGAVVPTSVSVGGGYHLCPSSDGNPDKQACCDASGKYADWSLCAGMVGGGGGGKPVIGFNGVVTDGTTSWKEGNNCSRWQGVELKTNKGSVQWLGNDGAGHFDAYVNEGDEIELTLTPPKCNDFVCGRWEIIDRGDDLKAWKIIDFGNGCNPKFKLNTSKSWRYSVTMYLVKKEGVTEPTPVATNTPTATRTPTPTVAKTPTPTPTVVSGTHNPLLKFRMSYAWVRPAAKCVKDWPISLTVMSGNESKTYTGIVPVRIGETNSRGEVIFEAESGSFGLQGFTKTDGVAVFVKGSKHLQMKYGKNNQTKSYGKAGGEIVLKREGEPAGTVYDFTGYSLLAGDINQDGLINGTDFALLKVKASKYTRVADGGYLPEDLDGNCLVNTTDQVLLINSLNEKEGELY